MFDKKYRLVAIIARTIYTLSIIILIIDFSHVEVPFTSVKVPPVVVLILIVVSLFVTLKDFIVSAIRKG